MGLGIKTKLFGIADYLFRRRCPAIRMALWDDSTQYGEFKMLFSLSGHKKSGMIVDVGANDGITCSNSYPFINRGWRAVLIEPNPKVFASLQAFHSSRSSLQFFNVACGAEAGELPLYLGSDDRTVYATLSTDESDWYSATRSNEHVLVSVKKLETILQTAECPQDFDILSIDTEGFDYFVLVGLNLMHFRPKVIVTEDEKPPYTHSAEKESLLKKNGYRLAKRFHNNAVWTLITQ